MKPNGKSFIAPTTVAKENKRKKVIDTLLILVLIAILAFDLTQAGMAYSKMNLEACVFEQRNREDMTRYESWMSVFFIILRKFWYFQPLTELIMQQGVAPCQVYMGALVIILALPIFCCKENECKLSFTVLRSLVVFRSRQSNPLEWKSQRRRER